MSPEHASPPQKNNILAMSQKEDWWFFNSPQPPESSELGRCVMRLLIAGWQITFSGKTISKGLGLETVIACLQVFSNWINAEQKECLLPKC